LNSPRRIAVAILCLVLGFGARWAFDYEPAPLIGLFAGMFVARLVPTKGSCALPPRQRDGTH
jgi:hypothetical protein